MKKYSLVIIALVFSLNVSAQARASVSASVTIVDIAGSSFTSNEVNSGMASFSTDSVMQTASTQNDMKKLVNADQTANLWKLNIIGGAAVYSITLPTEPITLSRLSGTEILTIQSLQLLTSNNNTSIDIIAACKPGKAQSAGYYSTNTPVDIAINYN